MRDWIPTPASAKGRLVLAALDAFGRHGFAAVSVADLARAAETTTGPLYHHFESKLGLYAFVREDVERRVLDRLEGALRRRRLAHRRAPAAFDYVARAGFARMLSEPHPDGRRDPVADAPHRRSWPTRPRRSARCWPPPGAPRCAASADGAPDDDVRAALRRLSGP